MFPESSYPLHIFEERYKALIQECYSNGMEFGINLISSNGINQIGCSVMVTEIIKKYSDGKLDIVIQGLSRFRINKLIEGDKPYFTAEVDMFADDDYGIDDVLLEETALLFNKIAKSIKSMRINPIDPKKLDVLNPSFLIAQKAGLNNSQKQSLLEIRSENVRLKSLSNHLRKMQPFLMKAEMISNIVKNDGYINTNSKKS